MTDYLTGLIWLKNANCFGDKLWETALTDCNSLNSGECGLEDGSLEGDWRLPNKWELEGLGTDPPVMWDSGLPPVTWTKPGSPFVYIRSDGYWSSTLYSDMVYVVNMSNGFVFDLFKDPYSSVFWAVSFYGRAIEKEARFGIARWPTSPSFHPRPSKPSSVSSRASSSSPPTTFSKSSRTALVYTATSKLS